ncbi:MAG TPA: porin [Sedimenticola thiotaurini]|uniref:Porin n=1 Tax=Sedimenticola thiotaurini TaxID=1543721 RepID=A0A831W7F6_9GAMM|nr:porin [Sedimenticola thiotaurini]
MNKKLITLAVAGAMVAPLAAAADTTLYGRIHTSLQYVDGDVLNVFRDPITGAITTQSVNADSTWDVRNETTRIGVKGSEDLGNGLKAIFQAEWAFNSAEGGSTAGGLANRLAYAGLTGGWGTAAIGRQWTPYYGAVDKADIFNGGSFNNQYVGTFRTGNAVAYVTPNFGGFVGKAALVMDAGDPNNNNVDAYNLSAQYDNGPISVGIGYHNTVDGATNDGGVTYSDVKGWGIGGSYNFGMFKVIAQYEDWDRLDLTGVKNTDGWSEYTLAGEMYMGKHTFKAMWGNLDYGADDDDNWAIGYQYSLSKRTRVYTEYGEPTGVQQDNTNANQIASLQDGKIWNIGLRHDF